MKKSEALQLVEQLFGYPLRTDGAVLGALKAKSARFKAKNVAQDAVDMLLTPNVMWELDCPDDLRTLVDPDDVQPSSVLAFQLIGYFAARANPFFPTLTEEYLRVDMAPGHDRDVVIAGGRFQPYAGPIFTDLEEAAGAEESLFELRDAQIVDSPEDERERAALAGKFARDYPRLTALFWGKVQELGAAANLRPVHDVAPPGPLFDTALSVANCLLGRAPTVTLHPALPAVDREDAASLTLGVLTTFATDRAAGLTLAHEIVQRELGVPLTRRWAQRIIDGHPATLRLAC